MTIHASLLFQDSFGTPRMRQVWSDENMVQKWLDCEQALVLEMAQMGLIPRDVATQIAEASTVERVTPERIKRALDRTRHIGVSLVQAFREQCGPAGEYYHLGLTTQDVLLTGLTLQLREAYDEIMRQLAALEWVLIEQARRHKYSIMIGRTHGQHAVPQTFGFVVASWLYEIRDHVERFEELAKRLFRAKFTATVGTRSTWGYLFGAEQARRLADRAAARLGLASPLIDIQTRSDRLAEVGFALANLVGTLGKIGLTIRHLNSEEVREVEEPWDDERQHSSSTMPNKRNPETSEWLSGLAKVAQGNASALLGVSMLNERDATRMAPELKCLPENFLLAAAALQKAHAILDGMQVHTGRMRENLELTRGLAMSEVVMLALWRKTGKKVVAHSVIHDIAIAAVRAGREFRTALAEHPAVAQHLTAAEIDEALRVEGYLGDAANQIDAIIAYVEERRAQRPEPPPRAAVHA